MAKRGQRIEPTFDGASRRGDAFAVGEDDRVLPSERRAPKRAAARNADPEPKQARRGSGRGGNGGGNGRSGGNGGRRRKRGGFGLLGRMVYWCLILALWGGIGLAGVVAYYGAKMPSLADWTVPDRPPNVKIVAVDGQLLANRGMTGGEAIGLHEMSPYIPQAVMAIEDRRFYSHFGVDPIGLTRAVIANVSGRRFSQGGSTLTQQLAKNLFLKPDRTLERKVQEVLLAFWLEHEHTKDQILEMYLNRVYFGSGAYGVEAAARRYFNKSARDVTLSEAALLAGLLKAPSRLSPARDPKAANARAELVLGAMREEGMIDATELADAREKPATRLASHWSGSENYVADRIVEELPALIGDVRHDIIVESTVDLTLQHFAEASIRDLIDKNGEKLNVSQGALVSIDNTGAVRAMVGGRDYASSQFDRAVEARRQPGSAFKPFVFVAALEQGKRPDSIRNDAPIRIGKWMPENYNGKYYGEVTLATALAKSLNSVAAQLATEVGPGSVVEVAQRLGIESQLQANTSIALGTSEVTPLELTAAYVPFANGGYRAPVHFVRRVTDTEGKVLYEAPEGAGPRVLDPVVVGMMNGMMTQTISSGTAKKAAFAWPAAGKTGTSQKSRDAWFVGYTANLTTGVWFGNDDGAPMKKVTGGSLPAIAWHDFMVAAHEGVKVAALPGEAYAAEPAIDPAVPDMEAVAPAPANGHEEIPTPVSMDDPYYPENTDLGGEEPTSSIGGGPVPPADVGGEPVRKQGSILDIIMGTGG